MLAAADPHPSPLADIGPAPPTVLVDSAGKPFDLASLKGKVVLVSFVYTTCTGVCPATTQAIVRVQNALKEAKLWGTSVAFVSITLDPKRDTPEVLRQYARLFRADPAAWHFLTGPAGTGRIGHRRLGDVGQERSRPVRSTTPRGSSCSIPRATSARSTTSIPEARRPSSRTSAGCSWPRIRKQ